MNEKDFNDLASLKLIYSIEGIGPNKIFLLISKFHSSENILQANFKDLVCIEGISSNIANKIIAAKKEFTAFKEKFLFELEFLEKNNYKLISFFDAEYPVLLKNIYLPPIFLYTKGNVHSLDNNCIAIVGTREPTNYGKNFSELFSKELASENLVIVSGMARGIDSIAHSNAIKVGGATIAVIGSGLDVIYPSENKKLYDQIAENGLIISEFEFGTKPDAQNFPRRNRIISGISLGTLIIETKLNGGAMQTAAYALEQGREVFALPGAVNNKYSEGTNRLIQRGEAKLVLCTNDILSELNLKQNKEAKSKNIFSIELNFFEQKILNFLGDIPLQIDEISKLSELSTADCLVHLLTLEFKGVVKQLPGKMFIVA